MLLSEIFQAAPDVEIKGLCLDSRNVKKGDVFFCIEGQEADGHDFVDSAIKNGAVAIVHRKELSKKESEITYIKVQDVSKSLNIACDLFFGQPSKKMTMFGITGTNGKTSTANIIKDVISKDKPCGYIGTIAISYGDVVKAPDLTTPDPIILHSNLKEMVDHGMKAVALEVSSHGLALGRVETIDFDYAIFTNLTYDHLDFHKTMENYFEAKKRLFKELKPEGVAILNRDDVSFDELLECCRGKRVSYGIDNEADYRAVDIKMNPKGTEFTLIHEGEKYEVVTNLVAKYNVYNLMGAIAALNQSGMPLEDIVKQVASISQIDGRMEKIDEGQDFNVIVDYAHTPDGFEKIFEYGKAITPKDKRMVVVFGCAGKRDKAKRSVLGSIAGKYCDKVIVTEEDPRNEKVEDIAREICSGIKNTENIYIPNRYQAIEEAIRGAKSGDCVLILGKGDEPYMYREKGREPWVGDHVAAKEAVHKLLG